VLLVLHVHDHAGATGDGEAMLLDVEVPAAHVEVLVALSQWARTVSAGASS